MSHLEATQYAGWLYRPLTVVRWRWKSVRPPTSPSTRLPFVWAVVGGGASVGKLHTLFSLKAQVEFSPHASFLTDLMTAQTPHLNPLRCSSMLLTKRNSNLKGHVRFYGLETFQWVLQQSTFIADGTNGGRGGVKVGSVITANALNICWIWHSNSHQLHLSHKLWNAFLHGEMYMAFILCNPTQHTRLGRRLSSLDVYRLPVCSSRANMIAAL